MTAGTASAENGSYTEYMLIAGIAVLIIFIFILNADGYRLADLALNYENGGMQYSEDEFDTRTARRTLITFRSEANGTALDKLAAGHRKNHGDRVGTGGICIIAISPDSLSADMSMDTEKAEPCTDLQDANPRYISVPQLKASDRIILFQLLLEKRLRHWLYVFTVIPVLIIHGILDGCIQRRINLLGDIQVTPVKNRIYVMLPAVIPVLCTVALVRVGEDSVPWQLWPGLISVLSWTVVREFTVNLPQIGGRIGRKSS